MRSHVEHVEKKSKKRLKLFGKKNILFIEERRYSSL